LIVKLHRKAEGPAYNPGTGEFRELAPEFARLRYVPTMDLPDERQAAHAASGKPASSRPPLLDQAAFHQAFEDHAPNVLRLACARVGPDAAEEVLADTFVAAWRARASFADPAGNGLEAWLIGISINVIKRYRRAEGRWLQMCADTLQAQELDLDDHDEASSSDSRIDAKDRARRLGAALAHIPRRERDPLLLFVLNDMSYEEISAALDIPVGTVRSRISRGRKRLADRMGGGDDRG
jgi:RNA polymerase sigma-70 factor (ECF subfamily)